MKAAIIVIAGIMTMVSPVYADEDEKINYPINFVNSEKAKDQSLKEFKMYGVKESNTYENNLFKAPKFIILEKEDNKLYKKAK